MYSTLRAYRDIMKIEASRCDLETVRKRLEKIIDSSANLFEIRSVEKFARGLLAHLPGLLHISDDMVLVKHRGLTTLTTGVNYTFLAGSGKFAIREDGTHAVIEQATIDYLDRAYKAKQSLFIDDSFIGYFGSNLGKVNILFLQGCRDLTDLDKQLIKIISNNVTIAFDNLYLDKEVEDTQVELIHTLGEVVENRSKEVANHVLRISKYSFLLAYKLGLSEEDAILLQQTSPMHDVGKIGIPDSILLKPGRLDRNEFEIMKAHATIGYEILKGSDRLLFKTAAIIALQHHEKFNGCGYPNHLKGEEIHIFSRIVAVGDVFDALINKRCYKEAWPLDKIVTMFKEERARQFDPVLVDLFLENFDQVLKINEEFS